MVLALSLNELNTRKLLLLDVRIAIEPVHRSVHSLDDRGPRVLGDARAAQRERAVHHREGQEEEDAHRGQQPVRRKSAPLQRPDSSPPTHSILELPAATSRLAAGCSWLAFFSRFVATEHSILPSPALLRHRSNRLETDAVFFGWKVLVSLATGTRGLRRPTCCGSTSQPELDSRAWISNVPTVPIAVPQPLPHRWQASGRAATAIERPVQASQLLFRPKSSFNVLAFEKPVLRSMKWIPQLRRCWRLRP